jgi:hypothetical protein
MTASSVERLPHRASGRTRTLPRKTRTVHNTAARVSSDGGSEAKLEPFPGGAVLFSSLISDQPR